MQLDVLKIWPDWEATRLIGEGSFGKVYEIVRNNFGIEEHCALKVITIPSSPAELQSMKNDGMDDKSVTEYYRGLVEEFVQEIALMSKLKGNINIVGYDDYAVIEHEDSVGWDIIIRMELLTALPTYIREHPLTANDVIKLATDICNALEACYELKIIHRDIKPDNIFVSKNGDFKLGDFGVARTIEKTVSGLSKKGTYTYMAPEVYKGETYGTNVDLYSLGIVMYRLLNNNREPFLPPYPQTIKYSDKNDALVKRINGGIIPPPANCNEFLSRVVLKSVSFKTWDRYQLPSQMKADLEAVKGSLGYGAAPILQADQVLASKTNSTGQSMGSAQADKTYSLTNPYNSDNLNVPNNSYSFNNSYNPNNSNNPDATYNFNNSYDPNITDNSNNQYTTPSPVSNGNQGNDMFGNEQTYYPQQTVYINEPQTYVPQQPIRVTEPDAKKIQTLKTVALVLGWCGAVLWPLFVLFVPVVSILVVANMVVLSIKPLESQRKLLSVVMLVLSVGSLNVVNIASAILYLYVNKTEQPV